MKKYTFAILSVMLCMTPLRAMAKVTAEYCASFPGDNCPYGCYSEYGSSEEVCDICPETTYSTTGLYCNACSKPKNAEFVTSSNGLYSGMEGPQECPWSIQVCDKNTYITNLTSKDWNANTELTKSQCESCPFGKHADNTTQEWDGNALSDPCEPKKFYITVRVYAFENCERTIKTKYDIWTKPNQNGYIPVEAPGLNILEIQKIIDASQNVIDFNTYEFPSVGTITLKNTEEADTGINIVIDKDDTTKKTYLTFQNAASKDTLVAFPHQQKFYLDINLTRKTDPKIYYCPSQITNQGTLNGVCSSPRTYDECDKPTADQYSDIKFRITPLTQCENGLYTNSWVYITNKDNYNWDNATQISVGDVIELPTGANELYLAPKLENCAAGTYNDKVICPTECEKCPDGFTSEPGTASKNACFINVPLTDNTGSFSLEETVKVYYLGN